MIKSASAIVFTSVALLSAPVVRAQVPDFTRMDLNAMNQRFNQGLNARMAAQQRQIIANVLANPQAMAAYRAGVCGTGMTPQQFAYKWAATGGCTPEGTRFYMNNEARNAYNEQIARQNYMRAQQQRAWAMQNQQQHFYNNQNQQGMMLGGWKYQYLPNGQIYWYR